MTTEVLWKDFVAYMEHMFQDEQNPPVRIRLELEYAKWPPPNETGYVRSDESKLDWHSRIIFNYNVIEKKFE